MSSGFKTQPGFMLYLSDFRAFRRNLSDSEIVLLLQVAADYIEFGDEPGELPKSLSTVWELYRQKLDCATVKYVDKILRGKYANYCKKLKDSGEEPPDFEVWKDTFYPIGN